jgi:AAA15 family ATPase/GTPase
LGISFLYGDDEYSFDCKYNPQSKEFLYEKFSKTIVDQHRNTSHKTIYERDTINGIYNSSDEKLQSALRIASKNNILIYTLATGEFDSLNNVKTILTDFADTIDFIELNNVSNEKTIEILKGDDDRLHRKLVDFIKKADFYLDDIYYSNETVFAKDIREIRHTDESNSRIHKELDKFKLVSVYKGVELPSFLVDSVGTKNMTALAAYIIAAIETGRVLIIDEIDSSLHFKLTRAIVSLFNNEVNANAQLIFTTHDISLMDNKKLLRKEQIWFIDKDNEEASLYPLSQFTAAGDGIRDTSDIIEKYKKGVFGAIPEPDLIDSLISDIDAK